MDDKAIQALKNIVADIEDFRHQAPYAQTAEGYEPPKVEIPTELWDQLLQALDELKS